MRLSQVYLEGFGIDYKKVRPAAILDILDGLLTTADIELSVNNTKELYAREFSGSASSLSFISKDLVLIKLIDKPQATKLYMKLYPDIHSDTVNTTLSHKDIKECLDIDYKKVSSFYRALALAVNTINSTLTDSLIIYSQYNREAKFVIIRGNTNTELLKNLAESGNQSPMNVDKVQAICLMRA